ncbi:MAG: alpha/beta hydrolase [Deltaproteobacteria bacterium]|nr:alpha/beta hydrolase [Deltaproteobacteria bacterium]MBW2393320.1 alpha/beta hydrolase [Deltaproteobacteria bacterium]
MRVRDVDLEVQETGEGLAFIWGHGLLGSMAQDDAADLVDWAALSAGCRLLRYDARGHGRSEATLAPEDYCWPELGRDMLALLDALGEERAVLGGVSMGCATSLHAAVRAPERVAGLVLMAPPTAWRTRARQARVYRVLAIVIDRLGIGLFRRLASLPRPQPGNAALAAMERSVIEQLRRADRRAVVGALRGAAKSDLPAARKLAALDVPVLILAWTDDPSHPVSSAEELAEILPRAELHVAGSAEDVHGWTQHMADFLESR